MNHVKSYRIVVELQKMSIRKLQITYHNILKMNIGLSKYESTSAGLCYHEYPMLPISNSQYCV